MYNCLSQWGFHCASDQHLRQQPVSRSIFVQTGDSKTTWRSLRSFNSANFFQLDAPVPVRRARKCYQLVPRASHDRQTDSARTKEEHQSVSAYGKEREAPFTAFAQSIFGKSSFDGAILSLALPAIVALAADPLLSFVDTIFVGQAGAEALAALGVNSALFTFSFLVFNFLATATTPLVAAALAKGDADKAGKVTMQALLVAAVLGTSLWGGLVVGADGALGLMGAGMETGSMHSLAKEFLVIRAFASPAVLVGTVGMGVFRGLQDMRTPLAVTLGTNAVNLVLDTVLILGLGWGVRGAATATCTAEWLAAGVYLALLWSRRDQLGGLRPRTLLGPKAAQTLEEFTPFLKAGGAVLMRTTLLLGTKTLAAATATRLGPTPIASHQVVSQLWLLSSFLVDSLAIAGQTLVAVELGRGDVQAARAVSDRLLQLGAVLGLMVAGVYWATVPVLPSLFGGDAEIDAALKSILPLAIGMVPINAAVYVLDGILVGASDFKFLAGAMVLAAATGGGLLLGVEPLGLGLQGVWGALSLLMLSRLATLVWRYQDPKGPLPPTPSPSSPPSGRDASSGQPGSSSTSGTSGGNSTGSEVGWQPGEVGQQREGEGVKRRGRDRQAASNGTALLANNALARPPALRQAGKPPGGTAPPE